MQLLAAMHLFIHVGAPDSDVVLSGEDLLPVVECLADQDVTEQPQAVKDPKLIFTSDCQDLRVGDRATKRRRTAGTASVLEQVNGSQRGARADRQADVFPGGDNDVPMPAGPLPKGWKVFLRVIGDGRRCKFLLMPIRMRGTHNVWQCIHRYSSTEICSDNAPDKVYESPFGRTFQTYAKAKQHWELEKQFVRKSSGPDRGRGMVRQRSTAQQSGASKGWPVPKSLGSLIAWLRTTAKGDPPALSQEMGFKEAVLRTRARLLDVRSTRRT